MAEGFTGNTGFLLNVCPFCDKIWNKEQELRNHLEETHNISLTFTTEKAVFEDIPKYYRVAKKNSHSSLKMKELKQALKENFGLYLQQLRLWINCDITKFQFYESVASLFNLETILIHHDFLMGFLKEIRSFSQLSKATQIDSVTYASKDPTSSEMSTSSSQPNENHAKESISLNASSCSPLVDSYEQQSYSRYTFQDEETLFALSTLSAWESDYNNIDKRLVSSLYSSIKLVIKNISKVIAIRRKCIRVKPNGAIYDTAKIDSKDINPDDKPKYTGSVTLSELLDALEAHPELIPLKSIYDLTIQTIMKSLEGRKAKIEGDSEKEDN